MLFASLSMIDLVVCDEARSTLHEAATKRGSGDLPGAVIATAVAFAQLLDDYEHRASDRFGRSPFDFGDPFTHDSSFFRGRDRDPFGGHKQAQFEDKLMNAVVALQRAMKAISLGLDYRRYTRFQRMTPVIWRSWGGGYTTVIDGRSPNWPPSDEDYQFCFDFVIQSAIRLQDFEMSRN